MPHLTIEYSANVAGEVDLDRFCTVMRDAMLETGLFELGGIRVRAFEARYHAIADGDPRNGFVHMALRIGAGRSVEDRKRAGESIFAVASSFLEAQFATPHFALSFAMSELDEQLSWKKNSMHARLRGG